jgi:hypothetical protein
VGDGTGYPASVPDKKLKERNDSNALNVRASANFGKSISQSGAALAIGAPGGSGANVVGKAYVYTCTITASGNPCGPSDNWGAGTNTITAKVLTTTSPMNVPDTGLNETYYGTSVSIDDDVVVVGAPYDRTPNESDNSGTAVTESGSAYVWRSANGNDDWSSVSMIKKLKMRNTSGTVAPTAYMHFGWSVSILGPVIAVGSPSLYTSTNRPQVNVFKDSDGDADYSTGTLDHHGTLLAPFDWVSGENDRFGRTVILDNTLNFFNLFVAAPQESSRSTDPSIDDNPSSGNGYLSGSVFVYGP